MKTKPDRMVAVLPREKLQQQGVDSLADDELLAIFLRTGTKHRSVVEFASHILDRFDGLRGLLHADDNQLLRIDGIGPAKLCQIKAVLELSQRYLKAGMARGPEFSNADSVKQYLLLQLREKQQEVFACLFLDNQHRLLSYEILFYGTIDGASVYPREVLRRAMEHNAAAVIFAHNHPSGIAEPSQSDRRITEKLVAALGLVDIRVLDHLIVGDTDVTSLAERGLL